MRYRLLLLFSLTLHVAYCQIQFSSTEGVSFQAQNCRFKAGDSLSWANPAYNDTSWHLFNTSLVENRALWEAQKGWFRYTFKGTKLYKRGPCDLIIRQFGESELYLDGKKIAHIGPNSLGDTTQQLNLTHVSVSFPDSGKHLLAIRYRFRKDALYFANTTQEPFKIWIESPQDSILNQAIALSLSTGVSEALAGIFAILSLLHFLFYRANPTQSVNSLLCLSSLCLALLFGLGPLENFANTLTQQSLVDLTQILSLYLSIGLMLAAVYNYLHFSKRWAFGLSISLLLVGFSYQYFIGPLPEGLAFVSFIVIFFNYIRVSWLGKRRGNAGDKLPWNALRFSFYTLLLLFAFFITNIVVKQALGGDFFDIAFFLAVILFVFLVIVSIPIGLSLSLVQDYTRTYESLRKNLEEVQRLSAHTLAQEQEKQQILAAQNETLERLVLERTAALNESIETLKATQDQLIQKEKMASLGELTAGIAHEIQNPLNFVNNFAEVSSDLIGELDEELPDEVKRPPAFAGDILGDLRQNLEKITHHGRRASSIVKGMLEHSRTSTGEKQPTNLNALADEYLRLAYHGYRATHKEMNCQFITDFDATLPSIKLASQDISRVVLNLLHNAFYALDQKQRTVSADFQPTIWLSTKLMKTDSPNGQALGGRITTKSFVSLTIRDNGPGIPEPIMGKIFQPFFTTKPTGDGTGLGLSLSFDIVTKGHQGELMVDSVEGVGTTFTIRLPVTS